MPSDKERGLLRQYLAEYLNLSDPTEAQKALLYAKELNRSLLMPIEGISFVKPSSAADDQATASLQYIKTQFPDPNRFILAVNTLISDLRTGEEYVPRFEEALKTIAFFLGLVGSRPEEEANRGPDVLWSMKQQQYLVIECKSGSSTDTIKKGYCGQLNTSVAWFAEEYDDSCSCTGVMIHPSRKLEHAATLEGRCRIMTFENLNKLKTEITNFSKAVAANFSEITSSEVRNILVQKGLSAGKIVETYTESPLS